MTPQNLFAAEVEAEFRARFPRATIKRHPETFGFLVNVGRGELAMFLHNVFAESRDDPPDVRRHLIARFVRSAVTPDVSKMAWEEVRRRLVPLLRPPTVFSNLPPVIAPEQVPISRPFAPFVVECVGVDSDNGTAYVSPHMIEQWGVDVGDVFETATENGRVYFVDDVAPYDTEAPYPIWYVAQDDSYESSRLAVPGWLAAFAGKVKGRPVAIVPRRDLLIVGGDGDERCLRRLLDSALAEYESSPRCISVAPYTVDEKGLVVPLKLDAGHPLAQEVAVAHVKAAIAEYEKQKEPLQKRLGEDVFVTPCRGLQSEDGQAFTCAIWSKDVTTLLPRADLVMLNVEPEFEDGETIRIPWAKLAEIVGDFIVEEPRVNPARWRTLRWPTEAMLSRLRAFERDSAS
jgi:hypothetical protein